MPAPPFRETYTLSDAVELIGRHLFGDTWSSLEYIYCEGSRATGAFTVIHSFGSGTDSAEPYAGLIDVNGKLYGTTEAGGTYGAGTVFAIETP